MDASGAAPAANQQVPPQHQTSLIRTDQVQKLPHLNDQQKAQHTQLVRGLWDILSTRDPSSDEYRNAHMRLMQVSQQLMKGMQLYKQKLAQQQAQQAQQAQQQAAAQQHQQRPQPANNPTAFSQLLPQVQSKVSSVNFALPPNISKDTIPQWIMEARLRYGMALQKQELGRQRSLEVRQQVNARQQNGQISAEEMQEFRNRQLQAEKLYREGTEFLKKFQEQQETFRNAQQNNQMNRAVAAPGQVPPATQQASGDQVGPTSGNNRPPLPSTSAQIQPGQAQPPAPHTINSAVNAARVQAGQTAMSPSTTTQPGQIQNPPAAPVTGPTQTPTTQTPTPATQNAFNQAAGQQVQATPGPAENAAAQGIAQPLNPQGPPRPLSHEAAMAQAAKQYSNNNNQQQQPNSVQAAANPHAHPPGYMQNRSAENSTRNINMAIPKNLNVSTPEPVAMTAPRPTLSGGPSHGAMGVMGQPAIQKHPGYVLEGEGQRVLSKKMLDILVRQVTGGGEGEGLTPDAEEVSVSLFTFKCHSPTTP